MGGGGWDAGMRRARNKTTAKQNTGALADLLLVTEQFETRNGRACSISVVVQNAQTHAAAQGGLIQSSWQAAGVRVGVGFGLFESARTHGCWKGGEVGS